MATPPRTQAVYVQAILGDNWDGVKDVTPFMVSASAVVDRVETGAAAKDLPLSTTELELVERWLAGHFYLVNDPLYMSKSETGASASFQRGSGGEGFETTDYGRQACLLDYSGTLRAIGRGARASMAWLGKPPSEQIPYCQRD